MREGTRLGVKFVLLYSFEWPPATIAGRRS